MTDPDRLAEAERELRILTRCTCEPPYPLTSGRHDPHCLTDWREDVDTLAGELGRLRRIEHAARAVVEHWLCSLPQEVRDEVEHTDEETAWLLDALAAEVEVERMKDGEMTSEA